MYIKLNPQRNDAELTVSKQGDSLIINDVMFDFSSIPDAAVLPVSAIQSDWFCGPVERIDGELHLSLLLPHGPNPSMEQAYPEPINMIDDGLVPLPVDLVVSVDLVDVEPEVIEEVEEVEEVEVIVDIEEPVYYPPEPDPEYNEPPE